MYSQVYNVAFNRSMTTGAASQCHEYFSDGVVSNLNTGSFKSAGVGLINVPASGTTPAKTHMKVSSLTSTGSSLFNNAYDIGLLLSGLPYYSYSTRGQCIDERKITATNVASASSGYAVAGILSNPTSIKKISNTTSTTFVKIIKQ